MSEWDVLNIAVPIGSAGSSGSAATLQPGPTGPEPSLTASLRSFEAYFIGEMLRTANRPLSEDEGQDVEGGEAGRMYREMFFEEIGRLSTQRGGLGLAESMLRTDARSRQEETE